jgi:hypothetical protein
MITFGPRCHDALGTMLCDRCGRPTRAWCTSVLDGTAICRACTLTERARPEDPSPPIADEAGISGGDYNYPGLSVPPDLIGVPLT